MLNNFFSCTEEIKIPCLLEKILTNNFDVNTDTNTSWVKIGGHTFQKNVCIEEIDVLVRLMKREWYQLQNIPLYDSLAVHTDLLNSRDIINLVFELTISSILECKSECLKEQYISSAIEQLNLFLPSVIPLVLLDREFILKISTCINNAQSSTNLYFHTFLDVNCFFLLADVCFKSNDIIKKRLKCIMSDLILISEKSYSRQKNDKRSVFICNCVKKLWLVMQLVSEKNNNKLFWEVFNEVLDNENTVFVLWLLKEISFLHTFDLNGKNIGKSCERVKPNYTLLENKLKIILADADSEIMLETFSNIHPLICDLWINSAKIEVYQIIWDYFSKRLNVTNKTNYALCNATDLINSVDTVMWCPKDCKEDFEYFVGMLVKHLREYPRHWGKMKGRIYSQLGPNKVKDLRDVGIKHVIILFLCLSSVNFDELSKKMILFLDSLPLEKKNSPMFWNIYTAIIIGHVKEGRNIEKVSTCMVNMLQEASNNQKSFHFIKSFIENLLTIINASVSLQLNQWQLIDQWLFKYLTQCYHKDLEFTMGILYNLLEKVESPDLWSLYEHAFKNHVYPLLKQIGGSVNAPGIIGKIAAKISLLIPSMTQEAFCYFNSEHVNVKISSQFLSVILEMYPDNFMLTPQQEILIIQAWVKICLLTNESSDLTRSVIKLDSFPKHTVSFVEYSRDPLLSFIENVGSNKENSLNTMKLLDSCFGPISKWLSQYLSQPENELMVVRIYFVMSQAFLHCGNLLYYRNKSTCPLTQLVSVLLLPSDFLVGKALNPFVLNGIKKSWNVYFEAIVKLNTVPDSFLERTLRDLLTKFMPYFTTGDSPMLKCIENETTANSILEKFAVAYFKHPIKESDANILKALKIINNFVECSTSEYLFKLLVDKTVYGLFEVVIFNSQRNAAIGVVKAITCSPLYQSTNQYFKQSIIAITEKHMAFNTIPYFQLMNILAKFIPSDLKELIVNIKVHLGNVERMRGVGFDKILRQHMEKLEKSLEDV
ncbi:unnamed protein product [Brassicogethes aeneus]|uniref:Protein MMS22-like n=1 Tax=Brassicogethes aeneus TaxID=1431903 RepID=A0A9P0APW3_BRAAE|nr:unnamed protein product [Brassicogethes aeneus]